jgi:hypothetical protein
MESVSTSAVADELSRLVKNGLHHQFQRHFAPHSSVEDQPERRKSKGVIMTKFSLPIANSSKKSEDAPSSETAATDHKTRAEGGTIMDELAAEVAAHNIVIYMKGSPQMPQCGFSSRASQVLTSFGVPYHSVDIIADPEKRQAVKEFSQWFMIL